VHDRKSLLTKLKFRAGARRDALGGGDKPPITTKWQALKNAAISRGRRRGEPNA